MDRIKRNEQGTEQELCKQLVATFSYKFDVFTVNPHTKIKPALDSDAPKHKMPDMWLGMIKNHILKCNPCLSTYCREHGPDHLPL